MKTRWWWWILALTPAAAGFVSIATGVGDMRSSGLMAGVSVSMGLMAIIRLARAPWRRKRGLRRWLSPVPALLLGAVSLLGLSEGLPEFLQARGLFIDVDSVGPVAVVDHGGRLVLFGNDTAGGFVWASEDGSSWSRVEVQALTELEEVADATVFDSSIVVLGQSGAEAVVLISADGDVFEESGRFSNSAHGTNPTAVAGFENGFVAITDIYGNDVEFYESNDARSWIAGQPSPIFDDGEEARDIACSDEVCVGVGFLDATYRKDVEADTGVVWVSSSGDSYQRVDHDFETESVDAIAWNRSGFMVVATSPDGGGLVWRSIDGVAWHPVSGPFTEMIVDGIEAHDASYAVFGRNPATGALMVWTSGDTTGWREATVATGLPDESQVRSVTGAQSGLVAVGIDGETFDVLVWTSPNGTDWQETAVLAER